MTNSIFKDAFTPDPGEERANEEMLNRQREEKQEVDTAQEEERILTEDLPRIRQETDLEENPPLENLEWSTPPEKSEHWALRGLGYVGAAFEAVDEAVLGRIGSEEYNLYKARRGSVDWLSEKHFVLGMLGEVFIPDSIDLATAGLAYIPNRFRKSTKLIKAWLKGRKGMYGVKGLDKSKDIAAKYAMSMSSPYQIDSLAKVAVPPNPTEDLIFKLHDEFLRTPTAGDKLIRFASNEWESRVLTSMTRLGMGDGVFDYAKFVDDIKANKTLQSDRRLFAELFQTPEKMFAPFAAVAYKSDEAKEFRAAYTGFMGIDSRRVQAHHIDALYDSLPLYDGLKWNSEEWWDLTKTLLQNNVRPGMTKDLVTGKRNLALTLGHATDTGQLTKKGTKTRALPHGVAHLYYKDVLENQKFWRQSELDKLKYPEPYFKDGVEWKNFRHYKATEWAKIVNRSEDILLQAQKQFDLLNPKIKLEFTDIVESLSALDDAGMLPTNLIKGRYQVPDMADFVKEVTFHEVIGRSIPELVDWDPIGLHILYDAVKNNKTARQAIKDNKNYNPDQIELMLNKVKDLGIDINRMFRPVKNPKKKLL